ncbi:SIR2 family protein [Luteibacter sp. PPL201]|uniref:SIR2 family protein n=1 Tax=Luteibacter sahnii TaxID=3021977 RepID=A0ABT6BCC2_9GAMM
MSRPKSFSPRIEGFIDDYVRQLVAGTAAVFAGAGLSRDAGFVNWVELLDKSAREIGLAGAGGHDLVALAQYYVNQVSRDRLNKAIVNRFAKKAKVTKSHEILARLPIMDWWTTNYDTMIEKALKEANRVADVKEKPRDMARAWPRRDAIVYKMHGDVRSPADAILQTAQYESYASTHTVFVNALQGDLTTKTFLFVGFSFTDPNLTHIFSRLPLKGEREHYFFVKQIDRKAFPNTDEGEQQYRYALTLQVLRNEDLRRYGVTALEIEDYKDVPLILGEIERRYRRRTVFISGNAEEFKGWGREPAQQFLTKLSGELVRNQFRVLTGFGTGVGTAVINGALREIDATPGECSWEQLIMRPFPQTDPNDPMTKALWTRYRTKIVSECGVAIFVFGNKTVEGKKGVVDATGMQEEFDLALEGGLLPLPIASTGYMAKKFAKVLRDNPKLVTNAPLQYEAVLKKVSDSSAGPESMDAIVDAIVAFMIDIND